MTTTLTNNYEGLFLLPQSAGSDLGGATELVKGLLDKVGAEIISFKKWDERRLAYEIKGNKRGLYFLCYFKIAGQEIAALERQCLLSEDMLRHLITRADHLTMEEMMAIDAQQELADEIKLRAEQSHERASASTSIIDREEAAKATATAEAATATEAPKEETASEVVETPSAEAATTDETA
tara:strand:- start:13655 stop:14197 length:543 start_codon:yes stop_codon:yes gene_type:complete